MVFYDSPNEQRLIKDKQIFVDVFRIQIFTIREHIVFILVVFLFELFRRDATLNLLTFGRLINK